MFHSRQNINKIKHCHERRLRLFRNDKLSTVTKIAKGNIITNTNFWKIITPFLLNKGRLENVDIMLNHNNKIICNDHELVKSINEYYINIIEKSGGEKPPNKTKEHSFDNDKQAVIIYNSYKNHPSILKIRSTITAKENIMITQSFRL